MRRLNERLAKAWTRVGPRLLPFADAASPGLPLSRLLRLALFQVSVGIAVVLVSGTLNRVMIVELGMSAGLVALMVALPLLFAPARALIGFRSDNHRSVLGWKRVPYIWFGTLLQFGGLAILPFALILLSGDTRGPAWVGQAGAAIAFLLVGAGWHTTQTAGLALAADLADEEVRPRVVALMYVMLLAGMLVASLAFGVLLRDFTPMRLIQVVQGAAVATLFLNGIALWRQEPRGSAGTGSPDDTPGFLEAMRDFVARPRARRFLVVVGLGTAAFSMQDILLEPYGGELLHLPVSATTTLTALMAAGGLAAFAWAARSLSSGADPYRLAAQGALIGTFAFAAVIFASPLGSAALFAAGSSLIGFGGALFSVSTLAAAMERDPDTRGLALGAWGAVQATAGGLAVAMGGALRDAISALARHGVLGDAFAGPEAGYMFVYHLEIGLLFAALVAVGPLVGARGLRAPSPRRFGLAEFPS